jgi:hypothetical protein
LGAGGPKDCRTPLVCEVKARGEWCGLREPPKSWLGDKEVLFYAAIAPLIAYNGIDGRL